MRTTQRREMKVASPWLYRQGKADQQRVNASEREDGRPPFKRKDGPVRPDVLTSYQDGKRIK